MNWFGPAKRIEIIEQEGGLMIRATGIRRVVDFLVMVLIAAGVAFMAWRDASWTLAFGAIVVAALEIAIWFRNEDGEVNVTEHDLTASGDLGGWSTGYVRFRWMDISGLEYQAGGENSEGGLYARTGGWSSRCLMAGLDREQAEEVIAAIYRRFPYVGMAEDNGGWSLFGGGSEIMTLGLSKSNESSSEK